ncbi:unnamed protein product [Vicia faba]|uniref:PH domain-containing protein n=1 Tax=Vicia faba TaxID=3906 RepID=A0AAV0ZA98_VICFA|nr:unnamed protein product [Vicia faba]
MDNARIKVRTSSAAVLNDSFRVLIGDEKFCIKFSEDSHGPLRIILNQKKSPFMAYASSSESKDRWLKQLDGNNLDETREFSSNDLVASRILLAEDGTTNVNLSCSLVEKDDTEFRGSDPRFIEDKAFVPCTFDEALGVSKEISTHRLSELMQILDYHIPVVSDTDKAQFETGIKLFDEEWDCNEGPINSSRYFRSYFKLLLRVLF